MKALKIGVSGLGVLHTDETVPDADTKFRMVSESGVFDYIERVPQPEEVVGFLKARDKYGIPIASGGYFYMLGRDEELLKSNLKIAQQCGSDVHNIQVFTADAAGRQLSDDDVADAFVRFSDLAESRGLLACFENHINMWSEHPGRVENVARKVEQRGRQFSMTMDHSHVVMKIDNPAEQQIQNLAKDVASGAVILDPRSPGNVAKGWIEANRVVIAHARPAIPNNPPNVWAKHPDGSIGRGVQYPWIRPEPGQWHSDWSEDALEPWKQTVRDLLHHHATSPDSRLRYLTLEMIPPPDYGAGAKYSIFENNVVCAQWIRSVWSDVKNAAAAASSN